MKVKIILITKQRCGAPTAFQAWEKSCEDTLALQGGLYQWALTQQNQRFEDRERLNSELFGVYIDGRNRTDALIEKNNTDHFNLYKYTRNADDDILMRFVNAIKKYCLMMLNLAMFMLQLMPNIMIMLNYLKNGLVVI